MQRLDDYQQYDALGLAQRVRAGELTAAQLLYEAQARLAELNPRINAVVCDMAPLAARLLENTDRESMFCGVPFLVKDLMLAFAGFPLSNGSAAMKNYLPTDNSRLAEVFHAAGLITFGRTNTSELGTSSLTNPSAFGATLNPWDLTKNAGGSSGGSSAAVAARIVPMAYASDGGGSIRLPASYCGIFGFKPSNNLNVYKDFSRAWGGAVVDHVVTISVRDSAAYLDLVSGRAGARQAAENPQPDSYLSAVLQSPPPLTIGLITDAPTATPVDAECVTAAEQAAKACSSLGHQVEIARWPFDGRALMRAFLTVVFHATHRDVGMLAERLGVSVRAMTVELNTRFMALLGSGVSEQRLSEALHVWRRAADEITELHRRYDVILTPTVATPPLTSDALDPTWLEQLLMRLLLTTGLGKKALNDELLERLIDQSLYQTPFTPIANMTGQPAMSVPLYWGNDGLPYGAHFMAGTGRDSLLFQLAGQLESMCPWKNKRPGLVR